MLSVPVTGVPLILHHWFACFLSQVGLVLIVNTHPLVSNNQLIPMNIIFEIVNLSWHDWYNLGKRGQNDFSIDVLNREVFHPKNAYLPVVAILSSTLCLPVW